MRFDGRCFYAILNNWIYTDEYEASVISSDFQPEAMWIWFPVSTPIPPSPFLPPHTSLLLPLPHSQPDLDV